jgi:hypothetical protein
MLDLRATARQISPDWKARLLAVLTSEGVSEPAHQSYAARVLKAYAIALSPFILWFPALVLLTVATVGYAYLSGRPMNDWDVSRQIVLWIKLGSGFIGLAFFISLPWSFARWTRARRERYSRGTPNPTRALSEAQNPPILYLRSFRFDRHITSAPSDTLLPAGPTMEQKLVRALRPVGPVLAIGRPNERYPAPGALRFYVDDTHWREKVEAIVPLCQLVIWASGNTAGLRWEIEHIIETLPPHRLLLWVHTQVAYSGRQRRKAWLKFIEAHGHVFPKPLPFDIRRVEFIAFDDDWTPRPIPGRGYRVSLRERLSRPFCYGLIPWLQQRESAVRARPR